MRLREKSVAMTEMNLVNVNWTGQMNLFLKGIPMRSMLTARNGLWDIDQVLFRSCREKSRREQKLISQLGNDIRLC